MSQRSKVLLVEDEKRMRDVLRIALRNQGYAVIEAENGADASERIRESVPDVILLDLGLPDIDGADLARQIRRDYELPIIVLSARSDEQQQVRALDSGADDYVTKPFREGELLARVRAALRRRVRGAETSELVAGDLRVDVVEHRVFVAGREVTLTPTEFKVLYSLARERGRVLTHHQLLEMVWGEPHANDVQYLRVYIKQIRQKIGDDPGRPKRICTVLGVGYRLDAARTG